MISPFHKIIEYQDDDWQEFLERLCLIDIFLPVIKAYSDVNTLKCVIQYIAYAYSLQSDKVKLGMDWQKNKQEIFEYVLAKPEETIYQELVLLKSESVLQCVSNWLDFQDNDTFRQLNVLKDLRVEMQISAVSPILKTGSIDYDQKFKNAEYANKLKIMIKDLESELVQNNASLKDAVKEVKQMNNMKNSRSVGSYAVR